MHPRHLPAEDPTGPRPDDPPAPERDAIMLDEYLRALIPPPAFRIEPSAAAETALPSETSAIIREERPVNATDPPQDLGDLRVIEVQMIRPNPILRRLAPGSAAAKSRLRDSLGAIGLRDPLLVRPVDEGRFEIVRGHECYGEIIKLGWPTVHVRVQNMTGVEAAIHALAGEYHTRRCVYDKYRLIAAVRDQVALQKRVEPGQISNREVHHLTFFEEGDVSEALATVDLVARLAAPAGVEPDDPRFTRVTRDRWRDMKAAATDEERTRMLQEAVDAPRVRRSGSPGRPPSELVTVLLEKNGKVAVEVADLATHSCAELAGALRHISAKLRKVHRDMRARANRSESAGKP